MGKVIFVNLMVLQSMTVKKVFSVGLMLLLISLLEACGQKGVLFLPEVANAPQENKVPQISKATDAGNTSEATPEMKENVSNAQKEIEPLPPTL